MRTGEPVLHVRPRSPLGAEVSEEELHCGERALVETKLSVVVLKILDKKLKQDLFNQNLVCKTLVAESRQNYRKKKYPMRILLFTWNSADDWHIH